MAVIWGADVSGATFLDGPLVPQLPLEPLKPDRL